MRFSVQSFVRKVTVSVPEYSELQASIDIFIEMHPVLLFDFSDRNEIWFPEVSREAEKIRSENQQMMQRQ